MGLRHTPMDEKKGERVILRGPGPLQTPLIFLLGNTAAYGSFLLSLSLSQKIAYDAQICFSLLHVRQMGALLKDDHPGVWDTLVHCFSTRRCDLVIPPHRNQGRRSDLIQ